MKRALLGVTALALVATLATACTDRSDRVGERPSDRNPAASPATIPPPLTATPSVPSTPSDTTTSGAPASSVPSAAPSAPDSSGTK